MSPDIAKCLLETKIYPLPFKNIKIIWFKRIESVFVLMPRELKYNYTNPKAEIASMAIQKCCLRKIMVSIGKTECVWIECVL